MRILLDSQVLYWWCAEPEKLGQSTLKRIAHPEHEVLVSTVSGWELLIKQRNGKLTPKIDVLDELMGRAQADFKLVESLDVASLLQYRLLPPMAWRDPFDHLLMAIAASQGARFCTADRNILSAGVPGLAVMDAKT
jgi:PIN domain nuclease of toxin-antitoxin system